jgi:hypothetical protein
MLYLKQSTSVVVSLGPFVDKTDGVTPETGLVSAIDHATTGILLSKNGGALTIRSQAVTASTYDAYGNYRVTLSTTDTGTIGTLRMQFIETATCLPVWMDFHVLAANVYDSLFGAATDKLDVNVEEWDATAVPAPGTAGVPSVDAIRVSTSATAADNLETAALAYSATRGLTGTALPAAAADAAGGVPISDAGALDLDALNTAAVRLTAARAQIIDDWVNGGRLDLILDIIAVDVAGLDGAAMRGTDSAALASVCTEARLAELAAANLPADVDTLLSRLSAARALLLDEITAARMATLTDWINGGRLDLLIDAIKVVTDAIGATGTGLSAIPWNAAWDAEVQSEVDDAINTAIAELGVAAPTATPTLRTGLMLLYMALRNKLVVQTSGTDAIEIYNDAGTKIASKAIADDGADYTESEMA